MTNLFRLAENTSRESEVFNAQIQQKRGGSAAPSSSSLLLCVMLGRHVLNKNTITHISEQFYYTPLSVFCKPIKRYFITFLARASCSLIVCMRVNVLHNSFQCQVLSSSVAKTLANPSILTSSLCAFNVVFCSIYRPIFCKFAPEMYWNLCETAN